MKSMSTIRTRFFIPALALLVIIFAGIRLSYAEQTIQFAPLPMEKKDTMLSKFQPLTSFLSERLKTKIEYTYTSNYATLLEKFANSEIDLTFLGPLPYVKLRKNFPAAEPIIFFKQSKDKATYTCAIATFPDNHFDFFDGKLQKIGLTQPLSTCGYLSANGLMKQHGNSLENNLYRYLGAHDKVALAIIRGEVAAGGLKTEVAQKYEHLGLIILAETGPLPPFALVANTRTLKQETIDTIISSLLELDQMLADDTELTEHQKKIIGKGFLRGNDSAYHIIRELQGSVTIPERGNY
ncbi:MAG: ABC transporter substrate-binding protein [Desulfobacterales bacterium]|nr:MAG: ABC transporter substrate-binding protein [Desulfobacterales bacterium]